MTLRIAMKNALSLLLLSSLAVAACGAPADDAPAALGTVTILEPAEGAMLEGRSVTVRLATTGIPIVPAGDLTPGTGHHHIYLDADLAPASGPVPSVPGSIVHMGDASSQYTFEDVAPGEHRLIAVVADGVHVPLNPLVVDTVMFMLH